MNMLVRPENAVLLEVRNDAGTSAREDQKCKMKHDRNDSGAQNNGSLQEY
jgi:hypothetical protein